MTWFSGRKQSKGIKSLLRMLGGSDAAKQTQAARELMQMGAGAVEDLIPALGSKDAALRSRVAQILVKIGSPALPALGQALRIAPSLIRQRTAEILGKIGASSILPILLEALQGEDYAVQSAAALALGEIGDAAAIPQLLVALSDSDPDVRIAVVMALEKFRAPQTYVNIADLLDDPEINVRMATAQTFSKIGDPDLIPYLVETLHDSFWWYGRKEEAIQSLLAAISSFGAAALDELIEAMKAKEPTVRRNVIALLRPLREPRIMKALEMAFYDTNYDVAESALEALLKFGEAALPILAEALLSPNDWIREKAVFGLGVIGGEQATISLLEMLGDDADSVRKEAIAALAKLKDPRALPTLRAIASDRSEREISRLARQAIAAIEAP